MKKIIVLGILMLSVSVNAQEIAFMYDADGTKVYFQVSNVVRYLQFEKSAKNSILDIYKEAQEVDTIMPDILKFTLKESDVVKFEKYPQ